jgi:hypothetical protein
MSPDSNRHPRRLTTIPRGRGDVAALLLPWPDAYQPQLTWKCRGRPPTQPGAAYQVFNWWYVPDGVVSPDGKRMKGSSTAVFGAWESTFQWELHLIK